MPESLEQLDLLLLTVARARQVHRDGVRTHGLRYIAPTLAAYVGKAVTVRFDPADMAGVRIFHEDRFVCRAICPELAGESVGLDDIVRARRERRRDLTRAIRDRRALVDAPLAGPVAEAPPRGPQQETDAPPPSHGLRRYADD